jgi:hypothetical protein
MILSVEFPSILIQGFSLGLKTDIKPDSPFQQIVEWRQSTGFHTTVISPLEYVFERFAGSMHSQLFIKFTMKHFLFFLRIAIEACR